MGKIVAVIGMVFILAVGSAYAMMDGHHGSSTERNVSCGAADCGGTSGHNHQGHMMDQQHDHSGYDAQSGNATNQGYSQNSSSGHQHSGTAQYGGDGR